MAGRLIWHVVVGAGLARFWQLGERHLELAPARQRTRRGAADGARQRVKLVNFALRFAGRTPDGRLHQLEFQPGAFQRSASGSDRPSALKGEGDGAGLAADAQSDGRHGRRICFMCRFLDDLNYRMQQGQFMHTTILAYTGRDQMHGRARRLPEHHEEKLALDVAYPRCADPSLQDHTTSILGSI